MDIEEMGAPQNEEEYEAALKAVRPYFENEPHADTPEAAHFDALVLLIEEYESTHFPIAERSAGKTVASDRSTLKARR